MKVRVAGIERGDVANSLGRVGLVIWFQGCSIGCKGCHNPALIATEGGYEIEAVDLLREIKENSSWLKRGGCVVFLGGEPTDQLKALVLINDYARGLGITTVLYTGLSEDKLKALNVGEFDVVKVGGYDESQKVSDQQFATANQYLLINGERAR